MNWFLIKKSFFDCVDNFLGLLLANLISAIPVVGLYFLIKANPDVIVPGMGVIAVLLYILFTVLCFGINGMSFQWGNYRHGLFEGFKESFKENKKHCLFYVFILLVILLTLVIGIPFYINSLSYFGVFLAFLQLWIVMILGIGMMYYYPLMKLFPDEKPKITFGHALTLAYRNIGFSLYVFLLTLIYIGLSVVTCSILPGVGGIGVLHTDAVRLIMIKEKYMQEHNVDKKHINVREMLFDENENIGERSLKTFFKPWKLDNKK